MATRQTASVVILQIPHRTDLYPFLKETAGCVAEGEVRCRCLRRPARNPVQLRSVSTREYQYQHYSFWRSLLSGHAPRQPTFHLLTILAAVTNFPTGFDPVASRCVSDEVLKPGGVLVYATCSLLPAEGEEVAKRLLEWANGPDSNGDGSRSRSESSGASLVNGAVGTGELCTSGARLEVLPFLPGEIPGVDHAITSEGYLRILPGVTTDAAVDGDGFFVARFRKVGL